MFITSLIKSFSITIVRSLRGEDETNLDQADYNLKGQAYLGTEQWRLRRRWIHDLSFGNSYRWGFSESTKLKIFPYKYWSSSMQSDSRSKSAVLASLSERGLWYFDTRTTTSVANYHSRVYFRKLKKCAPSIRCDPHWNPDIRRTANFYKSYMYCLRYLLSFNFPPTCGYIEHKRNILKSVPVRLSCDSNIFFTSLIIFWLVALFLGAQYSWCYTSLTYGSAEYQMMILFADCFERDIVQYRKHD